MRRGSGRLSYGSNVYVDDEEWEEGKRGCCDCEEGRCSWGGRKSRCERGLDV